MTHTLNHHKLKIQKNLMKKFLWHLFIWYGVLEISLYVVFDTPGVDKLRIGRK